jgi:hypothetical protein
MGAGMGGDLDEEVARVLGPDIARSLAAYVWRIRRREKEAAGLKSPAREFALDVLPGGKG